MSSGPDPSRGLARDGQSRSRPFGLRLAAWYATLFVVGALAIVLLTYYLTARSFAQRDAQILQAKLGEYAGVYQRGGTRGLADMVRAEQLNAPERLFVRVVDRRADTVVLSTAEGWDPAVLEMVSARLPDGTLVQVGKSTDARRDLLQRLRAGLGLLTLGVIGIALAGGWLATEAALRPIRRLSAAVGRIVRTGRTDERVPVQAEDDAINELTALFNQMLDRIEGLVGAMRGALDNVSHDLRTPLTRLRSSAESALAADADPDRCREALADCVEEADRVLVMLNTLMDISEAESGAMPLAREPVRLAAVVDRATDLYRDVAEARDIQLEVTVAGDPAVMGDEVRLQQVAANLLDNALKYTPSGGRVTVSVGGGGGREPAILAVQDTGAGIPEAEVPRIWDRLFRGDASRTARGLGLGLSFVKAIVEAHGGSVAVTSVVGRGSTFTVTLPSA
jgi:signal transduction histidine kinase